MINGGITGMGGGSASRKITLDHVESNVDKWINQYTITYNSGYGSSTVTAYDKIYVIGGGYPSSRTLCYDPLTNTQIQKANMPTARQHLGTTEMNGLIYALGGNINDSITLPAGYKTNECYDPITNTWTTKANMPTPKYMMDGVTASNGKIYVISQITNSVSVPTECYDPVTNTWATKAAIPSQKYGFKIAAIESKIYAIGGYKYQSGEYLATNECYDTVYNTWSVKASMPEVIYVPYTISYKNKIYKIDGTWQKTSSHFYDPVTNSWTPIASLTSRGDLIILNDQLHYIYGQYIYYYDPKNIRILQIFGDAEMKFDKQVKWNDEMKPANVTFYTTGQGVLSLIENNTSGTIKEKTKNITINNL